MVKLLILSTAFLLLFCAFNTAQNLASSVLNQLGFGNLGFVSLAVLYFTFAFCSFFATSIVNHLGERAAMFIGAICYTAYIATFLLPSAKAKYGGDIFLFNDLFIKLIINVAAVINGFGAGVLWVGAGKYLARIANDQNKGQYNSIFWSFFMTSQIVGSIMGSFILNGTDPFTFYCVMTSLCVGASLFFLLLRPVSATSERTDAESQAHTSNGEEQQKPVKEEIIATAKLLIDTRMLLGLQPLIMQSAINIAIFSSIFVNMFKETMDQSDD